MIGAHPRSRDGGSTNASATNWAGRSCRAASEPRGPPASSRPTRTTMRLILGLDRPTRGSVTVNGKDFRRLASPMHEVGALLDAKAVHGGRSAYNHLLCLAETNNLPRRRVGDMLELVGLTEVARKR